MLTNSLYFVSISSCLSLMAIYAFYLLFEYTTDRHCYNIATRLIISFYVVLMALVIVNIWTGCYFYFDENGYNRGPLNKIAFLVLFIELGMYCVCYFRNRKTVSPYIRKLVSALPPIIALLLIVQLLVPDILMTGTIAALANLIFYVFVSLSCELLPFLQFQRDQSDPAGIQAHLLFHLQPRAA